MALLCWFVACVAAPPTPPSATFSGAWETTYGRMTLTEKDGKVAGKYGGDAAIAGVREKNRFAFTYAEPNAKGEGWFELAADGQSFKGQWRAEGAERWLPWTGTRAAAQVGDVPAGVARFHGLWETTYGRMRLNQVGDLVTGCYAYHAGSWLEGKLVGGVLKLKYAEPDAKGEAEFTLGADGQSFAGRWRAEGAPQWSAWSGRRVVPRPGVVWLVVIEANWEGSIADPEYSFGGMLRSFFSRDPNVQVRHRFFTDEGSLKRWLREVCYLGEPVVISLSTHGMPNGLAAGGKIIGAAPIAEALKEAGNVKLLHFSSCLAMKENLAAEVQGKLGAARFPISGYATSVDWGSSAVVEFMYFDLLLCRGLPPAQAYEQIKKQMPIAGKKAPPGSILPALDLRFAEAPKAEATHAEAAKPEAAAKP